MKFAVTFCAMDPRAEANPMWHACILLSKMDVESKKLEVVDTWSFYGLPSTDKPGTLTKKLKIALKIDVNLQGNHGKWRHEETRYLDRGVGLHGRTFEVTKEQFDAFTAHMQKISQSENDAITEAAAFLKLTPKAKPRIYAYEDYSEIIFHIEKVKAQQEGRESRLKPFELRVGLGLGGPFVRESHTCKSHAISALRTVLNKEHIAELTEFGKHPTIPRYSGPSEEFFLYSTGPLVSHLKKSGETVYFRQDIGSNNTRLFWALPPQLFVPLSAETKNLWARDEEHIVEVKSLVSQLIRLEWAIQNALVPDNFKIQKELLLGEIVQCYTSFAIPQPQEENKKIAGLKGWAFSLFALHRSDAEKELFNKMSKAKMLLNCLYSAMVDNWLRDEDLADQQSAVQEELATHFENDESIVKEDKPKTIELDYAVAASFSVQDKRLICSILGRSYLVFEAILDIEETPSQTTVLAKPNTASAIM